MTHIDMAYNPYYRLTEALRALDKRSKNLSEQLALFGTYQDTQNFRTATTEEHLKIKSHVDKIHHDIKEIGFREEVESIQLRRLRKHFQSQLATYQSLTQELHTKMKTTTTINTYQNHLNEVNHETTNSTIWRESPAGYGSMNSPEETQKLLESSGLNMTEYKGDEEEFFRLGEMMQDVHDVFEDLSCLIQDQQSDIDDIETRVKKTRDQVKSGQEELLKSHKQRRKMRKRKCFFLIVLLIAALAIALTMYLTAHKKKVKSPSR